MNDLIVCAVTNQNKDSLLLIDHSNAKEGDFYNDLKSFWFPFIKLEQNETKSDALKNLFKDLESNLDSLSINFEILTVLRIHSTHLLPVNIQNRSKLTYFLCCLPIDIEQKISEFDNPKIKWMNLNQMKQALKRYQLMGLEPITIFKHINELKNSPGINLNMNFFFYEPKMTYVESNSNQSSSPTEQVIYSAKIDRSIQEKLFTIYYSFAYPSEYLNLYRFKQFVEKLAKNLENNKLLSDTKFRNLFFSFDIYQKSILTFSEFLLGIAAMDPQTQVA
jgi:hypothetical protein